MSKPSVVLISERFGAGGGEAIKAQQYAEFLLTEGYPLKVITAERSKHGLGAAIPEENLIFIPDTKFQIFLYRVPFLRGFLGLYFQIYARRLVIKHSDPANCTILHYISPVSPVALRFPPAGYHTVVGPLTGNIYYPPGFRDRRSISEILRESLHGPVQFVFGRVFRNKRNVDVFLVSGYERTRASLRLAGCRDDQMIDVVDAGVSDKLFAVKRIRHAGENGKFLCAARFVDFKGIDLAIRAVAAAAPHITLSIYGSGELQDQLTALVADLGLKDRVTFHGWVDNNVLLARLPEYRGNIMPSLAEANGIVMQEAMMAGLPVVTFRWGGVAMLADETAAIYIEPSNAKSAVDEIAGAMNRLAGDGAYAEGLSLRARRIAEERFTWRAAAKSWLKSYQI